MKICPNCAAKNENDSKFCASCGSQIEDVVLIVDDENTVVSENTFDESYAKFLNNQTEPIAFVVRDSFFHHSKLIGLVAVSLIAVIVITISIFSSSNKKLVGMWKIHPDAFPGYGICLQIDKDTIKAVGDSVTYGGTMHFQYEVANKSELVLTYDWIFNEWPWSVDYAEEIPLQYNLDDSGNVLTLIWSGTDFVFLDNTNNQDYFTKNGAVMTGGSVTFQRVK